MPDTQWPVFEVFHQTKRGEPHIHVGSVHAPDAELALMLARDQFARRLECVSLWVVRADHILATSYEDAAAWFQPATDKSYREAAGFRLSDMHRKLQEPDRDS